jgi:hypothetical protein
MSDLLTFKSVHGILQITKAYKDYTHTHTHTVYRYPHLDPIPYLALQECRASCHDKADKSD